MKLLFTILFSIIFSCSFSQTNEKIYHRAKIFYSSPIDLLRLSTQGVPLDHGTHKKDIFIESDFSENDLSIAKALGLKTEVSISDIKQFYISQNKEKSSNQFLKNASCSSSNPTYTTPSNWELGSMGGFYTYNQMLQELDDMASLYPSLITVKSPISNFQTFEGRSIYWVKISDNPNVDENEPEMIYDAIHHAREPASMQQLIYYMWYLLENYASNTEVQGIVNNTELYFIPVLNPDGYQYNCTQDPNGGGMWRKNRRDHGNGDYGVDNNRNYDYIDAGGNSVWGTTSTSTNTSSDIYCGTGPFSEIENQAMKWFCENHDFKFALNNHTYDNSLLFPYGYDNNQYTPDHLTYLAISDAMVEYNGLGMTAKISSDLYPASGDSDDWMYGADLSTKPKIYAFTPEISYSGFWPASNEIENICNSMVFTNLMAAHLITSYAKLNETAPPIISSISGHLPYELYCLGLETPSSFTVSINPISSNIISVGGSNSHNSMSQMQVDIDSISFSLDANISNGDIIEYEIIVNNGQSIESQIITKIYGNTQTIFSDNASSTSLWNSSSWNTTTSDFYSSPSSITDSPNGNYNNNSNTSISLSNNIDLSYAVSANLNFYAKWNIEDNFDYVQLQISNDGGTSWIPQCGKYTNLGTADQINAENEPLYDGIESSWVKEEINLSDYLGDNILMKFILFSDNYVKEDGFYFDDIQVDVVYTSPGDIGINTISAIINVIPNPATDLVVFSYKISKNTRLLISDNLGKVIDEMELDIASQKITYSTSKLSPGVYFYSLKNQLGLSESKKLIIVR